MPDRDTMPPVTGVDLTDPDQLEEAEPVQVVDSAEELEDEDTDEDGAADSEE